MMDVKTCKLVAINREAIEEAVKRLRINSKILAKHSNTMWDILLATEDEA